MERLVVKEFEIKESELEDKTGDHYDVGEKYSYFYDPETNKYYRPKECFEVRGKNLEDKFEEVK